MSMFYKLVLAIKGHNKKEIAPGGNFENWFINHKDIVILPRNI